MNMAKLSANYFIRYNLDISKLDDVVNIMTYESSMRMMEPSSAYFARLTETDDEFQFELYSPTYAQNVIENFKREMLSLRSITELDKNNLNIVVKADSAKRFDKNNPLSPLEKKTLNATMKIEFKKMALKYGNVNPTRYCLGKVDLDAELKCMIEAKLALDVVHAIISYNKGK